MKHADNSTDICWWPPWSTSWNALLVVTHLQSWFASSTNTLHSLLAILSRETSMCSGGRKRALDPTGGVVLCCSFTLPDLEPAETMCHSVRMYKWCVMTSFYRKPVILCTWSSVTWIAAGGRSSEIGPGAPSPGGCMTKKTFPVVTEAPVVDWTQTLWTGASVSCAGSATPLS